nr:GspH/FimT family pseudopilin [Chromobacterium aquaticum]
MVKNIGIIWAFFRSVDLVYRAKGFTLFELVITIAIAAIVLGLAATSYRSTIDSSNIVAELSDLKNDVMYARSEATRQGLNVLICSSSDGQTCSASSNWANGWIVMLPTGGGCTVSAGLTAQTGGLLRVRTSLSSGDSVTFAPSGSNTSQGICFSRIGSGSTGKFTLATATAATAPNQLNKQCLFVTAVGLPHTVAYGISDSVGSC